MKRIWFLGLLISLSTSAAISTKIDYSLGKQSKMKIINTELNDGEVKILNFPDENKIVEIRATEEIPENLRDNDVILGQIFYDIKIYETSGDKKTLISSPQIVSLIGEEATFEMNDTAGNEHFYFKVLSKSIK